MRRAKAASAVSRLRFAPMWELGLRSSTFLISEDQSRFESSSFASGDRSLLLDESIPVFDWESVEMLAAAHPLLDSIVIVLFRVEHIMICTRVDVLLLLMLRVVQLRRGNGRADLSHCLQ